MASQGNSNKEADYKKLNITNDVTITRNDLPLLEMIYLYIVR